MSQAASVKRNGQMMFLIRTLLQTDGSKGWHLSRGKVGGVVKVAVGISGFVDVVNGWSVPSDRDRARNVSVRVQGVNVSGELDKVNELCKSAGVSPNVAINVMEKVLGNDARIHLKQKKYSM